MPPVTPLRSSTQRNRLPIVAEAEKYFSHGAVLTVDHKKRIAPLVGVAGGETSRLDYDACLLHIEDLEEAAYRTGGQLLEIGKRPTVTVSSKLVGASTESVPEQRSPTVDEPVRASVELVAVDGEWLTSAEISDRYPQVDRLKLQYQISNWKSRGNLVKRGSGVGSTVLFDADARKLVEAYVERKLETAEQAETEEQVETAAEATQPDVRQENDEPLFEEPVSPQQAPEDAPELQAQLQADEEAEGKVDEPVTESVAEPEKAPNGAVHSAPFQIEINTSLRVGDIAIEVGSKGIYADSLFRTLLLDRLDALTARQIAALLTRAAEEAERLAAEVG